VAAPTETKVCTTGTASNRTAVEVPPSSGDSNSNVNFSVNSIVQIEDVSPSNSISSPLRMTSAETVPCVVVQFLPRE